MVDDDRILEDPEFQALIQEREDLWSNLIRGAADDKIPVAEVLQRAERVMSFEKNIPYRWEEDLNAFGGNFLEKNTYSLFMETISGKRRDEDRAAELIVELAKKGFDAEAKYSGKEIFESDTAESRVATVEYPVPLEQAVRDISLKKVEAFLDAFAAMGKYDADLRGALYLAVSQTRRDGLTDEQKLSYYQIAETLLDHGADPTYGPDQSLLLFHASDLAMTELLLKNGAQVNERNKNGYPAFWDAVRDNDLERVKLLFSYGAKFDLLEKDPQSSEQEGEKDTNRMIHYIFTGSSTPSPEMLEFLFERSTNPEYAGRVAQHSLDELVTARGNNGALPIHTAIQYGLDDSIPAVKFLAESGSPLNVRTDAGDTPLDLAVKSNYKTLVQGLLEIPITDANPRKSEWIDVFAERNGKMAIHLVDAEYNATKEEWQKRKDQAVIDWEDGQKKAAQEGREYWMERPYEPHYPGAVLDATSEIRTMIKQEMENPDRLQYHAYEVSHAGAAMPPASQPAPVAQPSPEVTPFLSPDAVVPAQPPVPAMAPEPSSPPPRADGMKQSRVDGMRQSPAATR